MLIGFIGTKRTAASIWSIITYLGEQMETKSTKEREKQERVAVMSILLFNDLLETVCYFCAPIDLIALQRISRGIRAQKALIIKSMIQNFKGNLNHTVDKLWI